MPATIPNYRPSLPSAILSPHNPSPSSNNLPTRHILQQPNSQQFYTFMGLQPTSILASTISGGGASNQQYSGPQPSNLRFRSKAVCRLNCKYCKTPVCFRAMKAVLLADSGIELFSTDCPPKTIGLLGDDYTTEKCQCRIRDVACITCGNQVGYHVTQPCKSCLDACNNGHMHMYHSEHIQCVERYDSVSGRPLLWATLPPPDRDTDSLIPIKKLEDMCRVESLLSKVSTLNDPVILEIIKMFDEDRQARGCQTFIMRILDDRQVFIADQDTSILTGINQFVYKTLEDSRKLNQQNLPTKPYFKRKN